MSQTRSQRFTAIQQSIRDSGLSLRDPGRIIRIALLHLEHLELADLTKKVVRPDTYYDMDLPATFFDSPAQHSTPCSPTPFVQPQTPIPTGRRLTAHYEYPVNSE